MTEEKGSKGNLVLLVGEERLGQWDHLDSKGQQARKEIHRLVRRDHLDRKAREVSKVKRVYRGVWVLLAS